jgi:hypothetical protein
MPAEHVIGLAKKAEASRASQTLAAIRPSRGRGLRRRRSGAPRGQREPSAIRPGRIGAHENRGNSRAKGAWRGRGAGAECYTAATMARRLRAPGTGDRDDISPIRVVDPAEIVPRHPGNGPVRAAGSSPKIGLSDGPTPRSLICWKAGVKPLNGVELESETKESLLEVSERDASAGRAGSGLAGNDTGRPRHAPRRITERSSAPARRRRAIRGHRTAS